MRPARVVMSLSGVVLLFLMGAGVLLYREASRPGAEALAAAGERIGQLPAGARSVTGGLAVVDYSRPGWHRRLALYDARGNLLGTYLVAHARNSGGYDRADSFSNEVDSNQSSLGLFLVVNRYEGEHGTALRLEGLDPGLNDRAFERDIVVHGADYVSFRSIVENVWSGKGAGVGRSLGCPAVSRQAMPVVARTLDRGGYLYIHR